MRDHASKEAGEWVHVADAASRVVLASVSRVQDQSAGSMARSGPAPSIAPKSSGNGRPSSARVVLPWPPTALTPHAKGNWRSKAQATRQYRKTAFWLAKEARVVADPAAVLRITYCPPDRQRRDCQNMHGRLKAAIDGIADAMGCDDIGFRVQFPDRFSEPCKGGAVVVEINPQFGESIP